MSAITPRLPSEKTRICQALEGPLTEAIARGHRFGEWYDFMGMAVECQCERCGGNLRLISSSLSVCGSASVSDCIPRDEPDASFEDVRQLAKERGLVIVEFEHYVDHWWQYTLRHPAEEGWSIEGPRNPDRALAQREFVRAVMEGEKRGEIWSAEEISEAIRLAGLSGAKGELLDRTDGFVMDMDDRRSEKWRARNGLPKAKRRRSRAPRSETRP